MPPAPRSNQANLRTYKLLRYGVAVQVVASMPHDTVHLVTGSTREGMTSRWSRMCDTHRGGVPSADPDIVTLFERYRHSGD